MARLEGLKEIQTQHFLIPKPLHCVSDPTLYRLKVNKHILSLRHIFREMNCFPESISVVTFGYCYEKLSGRHFRGEKLQQRPRVQEDKRRYLCEQITQAACSWENILKPTRFEFLHEFHFIYFLSTIARLDWVFIWRDQPAPALTDWLDWSNWTCSTIGQYFFIHGAKLWIYVQTINLKCNPLNSHHISSLCHWVWRSDALIRRDTS